MFTGFLNRSSLPFSFPLNDRNRCFVSGSGGAISFNFPGTKASDRAVCLMCSIWTNEEDARRKSRLRSWRAPAGPASAATVGESTDQTAAQTEKEWSLSRLRIEFDTSGKSPAYLHHRKNFRARARRLAAGFFESDGSRIFRACHSSHVSSSSQDASRRAAVRTIKIGMICSENRFPLFRIMLARTRECAGTRRGKDPCPPAASASNDPPCGSRLRDGVRA
jgi:hypothetical protein